MSSSIALGPHPCFNNAVGTNNILWSWRQVLLANKSLPRMTFGGGREALAKKGENPGNFGRENYNNFRSIKSSFPVIGTLIIFKVHRIFWAGNSRFSTLDLPDFFIGFTRGFLNNDRKNKEISFFVPKFLEKSRINF